MENKSILQKIKKLLNLAKDSAASEGEVSNAMRMAQELMTKHRLSLAEAESVDLNNQSKSSRYATEAKFNLNKRTFYRWEKRLVSIVARLMSVEALLSFTGPIFIGVESDAHIAVEMYAYLRESALKLRKEYSKANPGEREQVGGALWDESYMAGLCNRLSERVTELKKEETKTQEKHTSLNALAVVDHSVIQQYLTKNYPMLRKSSSRGSKLNASTFQAGKADGNKISLSTKVVK